MIGQHFHERKICLEHKVVEYSFIVDNDNSQHDTPRGIQPCDSSTGMFSEQPVQHGPTPMLWGWGMKQEEEEQEKLTAIMRMRDRANN